MCSQVLLILAAALKHFFRSVTLLYSFPEESKGALSPEAICVLEAWLATNFENPCEEYRTQRQSRTIFSANSIHESFPRLRSWQIYPRQRRRRWRE